MTPTGHALTGIAIGILALPDLAPPKRTAVQLTMFAVLANLPDLPLSNWGA